MSLHSVRVLVGVGVLLFFAHGGTAIAADGGAGVQITYLANEGFLLEAGETKVLVDALSGDGLRGYPVVPAKIRAELESARGRFAGIDLILASHYHGDHFDAAAVARHLRANPDAVFLSTRQAVDALRRELGEEDGFEIVTSYPEEGKLAQLSLPGVTVEVLNLHHGRGRRPLVENLGLLIRLGGLDLLHVGDTEAEERDLQPYKELLTEIDVWLQPGWLLTDPDWQRTRDLATGDSSLVAMHLFAPNAPAEWFGAARNLEGQVAAIHEALPEAWVPLEPLATRHYSP